MRILMLGNSLTSAHDLPARLAERTGAEVVAHTRGGARLAEQLNPQTGLGARTLAALKTASWDFVVIQEMSIGPVRSKQRFLESVTRLCSLVREHGAAPVLYATWAYKPGGKKLEPSGVTYDELHKRLHDAYYEAAALTGALVADVGSAFYERAAEEQLYLRDGVHPSQRGTELAVEVIAQTIEGELSYMT